MKPCRLLAPLLLLVASACPGPTEFRLRGPLGIESDGARVILANHTAGPVYTFVVERNTAALIDWIPCTDPAACEGIAPGAERRIPYAEINGYRPGAREGLVYWWHLEPRGGGGFRPDSIRTEVFRF